MMKHIIYCEDSPEGILSAVYRAYEARYGHSNTEIRTIAPGGCYFEEDLFSSSEKADTDYDHADSVRRTLSDKAGYIALEIVLAAAASVEADKADVIYHFIVRAIANGAGTEKLLTDDFVMRINKISRRTYNEAHHWKEFLRFREYHISDIIEEMRYSDKALTNREEQTLLISEIRPLSNVIPLIMDHFADRFNGENFIIYDSVHNEAGIHKSQYKWFIVKNASETVKGLKEAVVASMSDSEETEMESLWNAFFRSTAIKERYNKKLQRNLMPLYFRINKDLP